MLMYIKFYICMYYISYDVCIYKCVYICICCSAATFLRVQALLLGICVFAVSRGVLT